MGEVWARKQTSSQRRPTSRGWTAGHRGTRHERVWVNGTQGRQSNTTQSPHTADKEISPHDNDTACASCLVYRSGTHRPSIWLYWWHTTCSVLGSRENIYPKYCQPYLTQLVNVVFLGYGTDYTRNIFCHTKGKILNSYRFTEFKKKNISEISEYETI